MHPAGRVLALDRLVDPRALLPASTVEVQLIADAAIVRPAADEHSVRPCPARPSCHRGRMEHLT